MKDDAIAHIVDALDDLLDAERAALLQGNLDDVSRLHARKERLIDALNREDALDAQSFLPLQNKVARNQDLLNSALEGVRSVARRLAAIRRVRKSLETYDAQGKKTQVDIRTERSVEKRA
ncbi:flagellar biosynthesis protein FlgN [uncultured Tateyamaria sp.]|uniref:flagellar biosynthesis protein FlgN n=1 Tax=uncultured Tateyamaria sp. TaxID=455651 RepID=UPI002613B423|nr:flagellar biosynthesis protein FlgN [uncultured Tateyamaria sp.]